jgi:CBS domain-containing protein
MNINLLYSRNLVRAPASCTLMQAATLMRDNHVGALLVTEGDGRHGKVLGVITDRDLVVRAVAEDVKPGCANIGQFMTHTVVMIPENASSYEAMEVMRTSGVRRLGVTDANGELVGVVSLDDIAEPLAAELSAFAGVMRTERFREVMHQEPRPA